jgi:hypothetical protein
MIRSNNNKKKENTSLIINVLSKPKGINFLEIDPLKLILLI